MSTASAASASASTDKPNYMSRESASKLLSQCDEELKASHRVLEEAKELTTRAHLVWTDTSILDPTFPEIVAASQTANASTGISTTSSTLLSTTATTATPVVLRTTGGHSNTDHVVTLTGNVRTDRINELKRALQKRARAMQPETTGQDRWDKPRIPGERRRRIVRDRDLPQAPPEPPPSGYVVFVGQMTTKIRHDRPHEPHNQVKVTKEIGKIWRYGISENDRQYYDDFAREAREEYQEQYREYRATGRFTPSTTFEKLDGGGVWVRKRQHEKNGLEREIASFDSVKFPPRPPEMDEAYRKREEESKRRRKEKVQAMRKQLQVEEEKAGASGENN